MTRKPENTPADLTDDALDAAQGGRKFASPNLKSARHEVKFEAGLRSDGELVQAAVKPEIMVVGSKVKD